MKKELSEAALNSARSAYFWACVVYVAYCSGMLAVDYCPYGSEDSRCDYSGTGPINKQYLFWGAVHLINAFQFLFSWYQYGVPLWHPIAWADYLNIVGATLYMVAAIHYPDIDDIEGETAMLVHKLELSASIMEVVAALMWAWSWWYTYTRQPGRGWTFDDPDLPANIFIVVPSFVYLAYNIQIFMDFSSYGENSLYIDGDILYFVGSIFYLFASMRDSGWWFFMPMAGGWDYQFIDASEKLSFGSNRNYGSVIENKIDESLCEREATLV